MAAFPLRREIRFVEFPDDPKSRSALIVSLDARNELANCVLAVPVTTNLRPSPTHVALPANQGGLTRDSMARCEIVRCILPGTISPVLMREVER